MTDEQKISVAWNDMEVAVQNKDLTRIFKLAYWIKHIIKSYGM